MIQRRQGGWYATRPRIHTAIRRRSVDCRARGDNPRVLTRGSMQGSTPRSRGAWEDGRCWCRRMLWAKHAVQTPDTQLPVRFFKSPHAKPLPPAPRACGVPPCTKPTVRTVGMTTHAYPPRNAAAWRCGLAPRMAPLRAFFSRVAMRQFTSSHKIWRSVGECALTLAAQRFLEVVHE